MAHEKNDLSLKATELRLGLPGTEEFDDNEIVSTAKNNNKRALPESDDEDDCESKANVSPAAKSQIVGWPPVRSYRKNNLRKIDLKLYGCYPELLCALENMFKLTIGDYCEREGYKGSEYAPAYEDKDGDLMLVGDVPWEMFLSSCKRLRLMRGSEARGLGCGV